MTVSFLKAWFAEETTRDSVHGAFTLVGGKCGSREFNQVGSAPKRKKRKARESRAQPCRRSGVTRGARVCSEKLQRLEFTLLKDLRLAIIGCGALTEVFLLPALSVFDRADVRFLVDKSLPRAQRLAGEYHVPQVAEQHAEVFDRVDAAIVALPNYLHAPVTIELLRRGIHVLVEKPMALNTSECDEMIETARSAGVVLSVGMVRRFYASSQFVKDLLERRLLGKILNFDLRDGTVFNWPVASDSLFRKEVAGGGVLADTGVHYIDLLLWWLGDCDPIEYYDDASGGVEADCELCLRLKSGVSGTIELSRTRNLRSTWVIRGEYGLLEIGTKLNAPVNLQLMGSPTTLTGQVRLGSAADRSMADVFVRQLDNFVDSIENHREPLVSGKEGRRSIALIETCYALRKPLEKAWGSPVAG